MAESQSRRLAAILAADIAGYSALMGADEARTVRDLKGHQAVVLPMIGQFGGRIIDTAGDGVLAEFASVVSAVKCALALQKTMAERNAAIEPDRRMQFRIGVNVGDVIYDKARIYGDGVNVAARLEDRPAGRHLPVRGRVPAGAGQARYSHRRRRRTEPEKHFEPRQGLSYRAVGGGCRRRAIAARRAETAMVGAGHGGRGDNGRG